MSISEQQAEQLMKAGKISNYAVVDGKVEIKSWMGIEAPHSWPEVNERSK
jgi:hypothetical protein